MPRVSSRSPASDVAEAAPVGPILGVDPGLQRTGYALLVVAAPPQEAWLLEAGVIRLPRDAPLAERLVELEDSLQTIIRTHAPAVLVCEELYAHYRHPRTAILMAHARGTILTLAARCGLHVISVAATNVKKLLTGSGHASKRQMQLAVAATLRLPTILEPHDVADAVAIALCGLRLRHAAATTARQSSTTNPTRTATVRERAIGDRPGRVRKVNA